MKRFIALLVMFAFLSTSLVGCGPEPDTVTRTKTLADGSTVTMTYSGDDAEEYLDDLDLEAEEALAPVYDNDKDFYAAQEAADPDYYEYGHDGYGYAPQGYAPRYPGSYNSHLSDIVMGVMIGNMLSNSGSYRTSHRTTVVNKTVINNNAKTKRNTAVKKRNTSKKKAKANVQKKKSAAKQKKAAATKKKSASQKKAAVKKQRKQKRRTKKRSTRRRSRRR